MAYDESLAGRVRTAVASRRGVGERKMFGGLAFLLNGKMFCGVLGEELMLRLGREAGTAALKRTHVRPMDFTGRPMSGYVFVGARGVSTAAAVERWIEQAVRFLTQLEGGKTRRPS